MSELAVLKESSVEVVRTSILACEGGKLSGRADQEDGSHDDAIGGSDQGQGAQGLRMCQRRREQSGGRGAHQGIHEQQPKDEHQEAE